MPGEVRSVEEDVTLVSNDRVRGVPLGGFKGLHVVLLALLAPHLRHELLDAALDGGEGGTGGRHGGGSGGGGDGGGMRSTSSFINVPPGHVVHRD